MFIRIIVKEISVCVFRIVYVDFLLLKLDFGILREICFNRFWGKGWEGWLMLDLWVVSCLQKQDYFR